MAALEKKNNDIPLMYSIGTDKMVRGIINSIHKNRSNLILVNMGTMARNLISEKTLSSDALAVELVKETRHMVRELSEAYRSGKWLKKPTVIFYLFDYYLMIHSDKLRPNTGARLKLNAYLTYMCGNKEALFGDTTMRDVDNIRVGMFSCTQRIEPYLKLQNIMREATGNRRVCMASHMPVDYHVRPICDQFVVVLSHTGRIVQQADLADYVFGDNYFDIPFYPETHNLLGDKHLLKPTMGVKEKRELVELATREDWASRSRNNVVAKMTARGIIKK